MDFLNLLNDIQTADPEFADRISPRRSAIKNITSFGSKVAVASLPFAISALFKKAYGQSLSSSVVSVLNFALTAEYLESSFYNKYLSYSYIPSANAAGLALLKTDETNHVNFLKSVLGSSAIAAPSWDFSGGSGSGNGPFASVETSYDTFLALAQTFEDNGVRAYKGQATALMGTNTVLTAALNIHSVEARHASYLRRLRQLRGVSVKPWITGVTSGITGLNAAGTAAVASIYSGEDNVSQGGADITKLPAISGTVAVNAATEAFDEPLTMAQVLPVIALFKKP
ncbi:ferritin-like domain-containing protein [Mucilaginibacter robiniae]|uniref:Ferritin-like domain-containing protein n=1 Tax=Mucilaginibacter robiniae TaxID=2728022 RepID=A0A7L5E3L3_9SPHI|nr:ferritin-like domain-containing protein [Mucilaginibacter robiniae]QJD97942.1 ferritin-like domain-containing protein [Mucilaginibacter robiniae]